jgi:putative membrane protein
MVERVSPQRWLIAIFSVIWLALAISPHDRATWALENILVLLAGVALFVLRHRFKPSLGAAILLFLFLSLHEVGAHYTYSKVPYDAWFEALTGERLSELLGLRRNHFDRVLHFGGGFLLMRLIRELIATFSRLGPWGVRSAALSVVMSASMIYELIEWAAAATVGKEVGAAYLGTQGDEWDAHKDMALATLGGILAELISLALAWRKPSAAPGTSSG